MHPEEFVLRQLELLELEKQAEIDESKLLQDGVPSKELERQGICLRKLRIGSKRSGLYGRTLVTFEPQWNGKALPSHCLTSGDIVGVTNVGDYGHQNVLTSGIVWATPPNSVTVAFDGGIDELTLDDLLMYGLIKLANNITYKRIKSALEDLRRYTSGRAESLISILFGNSVPFQENIVLNASEHQGKRKFLNEHLDASQQNAVEFALKQKELAIIHGPPGTGKTTVVVEIIRQLVGQGLKVLACAPSNVAVDNLGERLFVSGVRIVRLGHPARTLGSFRDMSLDALVSTSDNWSLACDIRTEMESIQVQILKSKDKNEKRRLRGQVKELARDLTNREVRAVKEVLQRSEVTMATLTSSYVDGPLKHLGSEHFDVVVIDESSQALEAACWIALLRAPKCILAGDHLQLPPTIVSTEAAKGGFEVTLMERLMGMPLGRKVTCMLTTQYRMNEVIMKWPSQRLYGDKLTAHSSVKGHVLCHLDGVERNETTILPLLLIDTAGCDLGEVALDGESSKANEGEAQLVAMHVEQLVASGVASSNIAVIAPYNLQVDVIRSLLSHKYTDLEIKSVDGFQGREKEAVILSLVRSNAKGEVGFLIEDRRINVAITRARRHLAVIGDSDTVSHHPFLKDFVDYLNNVAEVTSAHHYLNEMSSSRSSDRIIKLLGKSTKVKRLEKTTTHQKNARENTKPDCNTTKETNVTGQSDKDYQRFHDILIKFARNDKQESHAFPPSLSSFERKLIHSIAEKLGLEHHSHDEGDQRYLTVKKPLVTDTKLKHVESPPERKQDMGHHSQMKIENLSNKFSAISVACDIEESVEDVESDPERTASKQDFEASSSVADKTKNKKRETKSKTSTENRAKEDLFLDKVVRQSKKCSFPRCKRGTVILRQVCNLCNQAFCLEHHIPEVHGCGDAARALARQRIRKERVLVPGSGTISKKPKPQKRAQLEKKLEKKLTELNSQRSKKKEKK